MKAVSLFSGAGGMDVGFRDAGYQIVVANEWNRHASTTFRANHPSVQLLEGDIDSHLTAFPAVGEIDCVFGGPPCQGFSVAGKMDPNDPRSKLVFSFLSVVERTLPKAFVLENVKALATLEKFVRVREEMVRRAERIGYSVSFRVLNSKDFGVPQSRERMFMIGFRGRLGIDLKHSFFDRYRRPAPHLREVFAKIGPPGSPTNPATCLARITLAERPILRRSPYAGMLFNGMGRPVNPNSVSCTLPASMGGNKTPIVDDDCFFRGQPSWVEWYHKRLMDGEDPLPMHSVPSFLRRLTIREAMAIQTFPDNYTFEGPKGAIYTQIGNAVPCRLAYAVASTVRDALVGVEPVSDETSSQLKLV